MPDGFDASMASGVIDVKPQLSRRDLRSSAAVRVAEIVMAPLTVLVGGALVLAGMVLWGVWLVSARVIRPLLYTLAGITVVAVVLLIGGVMGYAYHAYELAGGRPEAIAGLAEAPPVSGRPPLAGLPPQVGEAPHPPSRAQSPAPAAPAADPFGLKPPGR